MERTYNQINQQESAAYMNRSNDDATVLIERNHSERITVGRLDKDTRKVYFKENGQVWEKRISMDALTDEHQQALATALAGRALRSEIAVGEPITTETSVETESEAIAERLAEIANKYNENDSHELWRYASGTINASEYRQDGDAGSAAGESQKAGDALTVLKKIGTDAVADAQEYLQLMQKQQRILRQ